MNNISDIIAYSIVAIAVGLSGWLLWRRWHRPDTCGKNGCTDCPLAHNCTQKPQNRT